MAHPARQNIIQPFRGTHIQIAHPNTRGIHGRWLCNEGTGDKIIDSSRKGNHGTLTNMDPATDWVEGKNGFALDFDGSDDHVLIPGAVITAAPLTLMCWFNVVDITSAHCLISIANNGTDNQYFELIAFGAVGGDPLRMDTRSGGLTVADASIPFSANTWHFAAGTVDEAGNIAVYLDGGNRGTNTGARTPTSLNSTSIGSLVRLSQQNFTTGRISNAMIYNRALSEGEVLMLFRHHYADFR